MKLPHKDDPHGDKEGSLQRSQILDVLIQNKVSITPDADSDMVDLETEEEILAVELPPIVGGLVIRLIARTFDIDITDFYYPRNRTLN